MQAVWVHREGGRPRLPDSTCAVPDSSQVVSWSILASMGVVSTHGSLSCCGTSAPKSCASSCRGMHHR